MKKKHIIIIIIILFIIIGIIYEYDQSLERIDYEEDKEELILNERKELNDFLGKKYDYYVIELPEHISVGRRNVSVKELQYSRYIITDEVGLELYSGNICFIFTSVIKAEKALEKLEPEEKDNYYLLSKTIIYVGDEDEDFRLIIESAQKCFNDK